MDLSEYRNRTSEKNRTADLMRLFPEHGSIALDIGARDGHFSRILAERFDQVVALDLELPQISHSKIRCVKGDVTALEFADNTFGFVLCAEVLEHIPPTILEKACTELSRVSQHQLLIGVPYRQDIRVGRTTCRQCGGKNPPWGHVNSFDEQRLQALFPNCKIERISFVGETDIGTNALATRLMDFAGNPYGTYAQAEPCVHCGAVLQPPKERTFLQKVATRCAFYVQSLGQRFRSPHPNWIHLLLTKQQS